ncbi:hypothetical protein PHISP_04394 [Aspergillus sp. HF37]|nr:hypothetical protein PHISP_04394 [Aspergillus sp. HF37]
MDYGSVEKHESESEEKSATDLNKAPVAVGTLYEGCLEAMGDDAIALPGEGTTQGDEPCTNELESEVVESGVEA